MLFWVNALHLLAVVLQAVASSMVYRIRCTAVRHHLLISEPAVGVGAMHMQGLHEVLCWVDPAWCAAAAAAWPW